VAERRRDDLAGRPERAPRAALVYRQLGHLAVAADYPGLCADGAVRDCFDARAGSRHASASATSRWRDVSSVAGATLGIAIVGLDRGDDRFGHPDAD